ncbi:hypothetical protein CXF95_18835 [Paraglaciecola sp. MB-3u-78]|nr:hypothetical protein CXF95_18835 [Paraglaciecola sp. MB-3u-78]
MKQLEELAVLDGRFSDIECINCHDVGVRKGVTALVFSAFDTVEEEKVAIKFLDPDLLGDSYRQAVFEREPVILKLLNGKKRCLAIVHGPSKFDWAFDVAGNLSSLPIKFFVTNWLDIDVEPYFVCQDKYDALEKLNVFRNTVLATASFHSEGISHRDLKSDNFRGFDEDGNLVVVVIDFGTAAHYDMPPATSSSDYPDMSVGAPAFSAPESLIGLAGYRNVGKSTDIYALGALLYQLFNPEIFAIAREKNVHFLQSLTFLKAKMASVKSFEEKEELWASELKPFKYILEPPKIEGNGHSIPSSIINILDTLHRNMTVFDYNLRLSDLDTVLKKVDSAIRVLTNQKLDRQRAHKRKVMREHRINKLCLKEKKLTDYLALKNRLESKC